MLKGRKVWQYLYWTNFLIIIYFWWKSSAGSVLSGSLPAFLISIGGLFGLLAGAMILVQFFLVGRTPYLEKLFGLDKLTRIHHTHGQIGFILLVLHPILIIYGTSELLGNAFLNQFISTSQSSWHFVLALLAVIFFTLVVASSLYIFTKKLRYESWYFVHLVAYLAVFFSFWHQIEFGTTINSNTIFYSYWIILYSFVFGHHLVFRFIRPIFNFYKHRFYISRIKRENHNTISIYLSGKDLGSFNIYPGQFMILRFFKKRLWWQAHPFSLSMVPNGKELRITVKELGDFTTSLDKKLKTGTKVMIDGPYGIFHELWSFSPKVLFIAGGIGITPIRSLMEKLLFLGKDVKLIYANKSEQDIVFKEEIENLSQKHSLQTTHVLSDQLDFRGEVGYVDDEKIKRLVPDFLSREIFLCGPPQMMDAVLSTLSGLGVSKSNIHFEKFSLH